MPVISASTSPVNPVVIKLPQPIITILINAKKIITHVNGFGFSFKKITERIAVKIGADAMMTKVLATAVCCKHQRVQ